MSRKPSVNRKKLRAFLIFAVILLLCFLIVKQLGFGIPCVFHLITGLKCPGCGVTRMFLHLASLEFKEAFYDNICLFCLLPPALVLIIYHSVLYLTDRKPSQGFKKAENRLFIVLAALLIIWGIIRNPAGF